MKSRIEELAMNAWPSLQTILYDGWVLRFSEGYSKRANSINPIYSSTINIDDKINYCEDIYFAKGLPAVYKITNALYPRDLDNVLEDKGYNKVDETSLRILDFANYIGVEIVEGIEIENQFSKEWFEGFTYCSNITDRVTIEIMTKMLSSIIGEKICVKMRVGNEIVACGFGAIEDNYVGLFDIIVNPQKRGNGYGLAIMQAILTEAKNKNIQNAYLQVMVGNLIAENLYDKLGFIEAYRYWYRITS